MAVFKMEKNGKITWASKFRYETWNGEIKQKKKALFAKAQQHEVQLFLNANITPVSKLHENYSVCYDSDNEIAAFEK